MTEWLTVWSTPWLNRLLIEPLSQPFSPPLSRPLRQPLDQFLNQLTNQPCVSASMISNLDNSNLLLTSKSTIQTTIESTTQLTTQSIAQTSKIISRSWGTRCWPDKQILLVCTNDVQSSRLQSADDIKVNPSSSICKKGWRRCHAKRPQ